jgi:hypothetical protein
MMGQSDFREFRGEEGEEYDRYHDAGSCLSDLGQSGTLPLCGKHVYWWDGEYEGDCELPEGHEGDHWDGRSWYDDDGNMTGYEHAGRT